MVFGLYLHRQQNIICFYIVYFVGRRVLSNYTEWKGDSLFSLPMTLNQRIYSIEGVIFIPCHIWKDLNPYPCESMISDKRKYTKQK